MAESNPITTAPKPTPTAIAAPVADAFTAGDIVHQSLPQQLSYQWHGTVVNFDAPTQSVSLNWQEFPTTEPLVYPAAGLSKYA